MPFKLAVFALVLSGCGALENLIGIEEQEAAAECQQIVATTVPDSTIPEHVRQYYPQVTVVLTNCPK